MDQNASLPTAYNVIKLFDLNTSHSEIASRTGLTEDYVGEIEAWTKAFENSSPLTRGAITATEGLVLWYFRDRAAISAPDGRMAGVFGTHDLSKMVQELGAETTSEITEVVESLRRKGILDHLIGSTYLDILPEEFLDPQAWEGPPSRLLVQLLEQHPSGEQKGPDDHILYFILRKDTLRILIDTGEFITIISQIIDEEATWVRDDARWPHFGPIYIELTEASPELPEEYSGAVHSYIITEDFRDDARSVLIPTTLEGEPGTTGAMFDLRTGQITGMFGPEERWERISELARYLIIFITDPNYEIVEMPLNRRSRRRLKRSGAPNPWHVVRRRGDTGHL